MKNMFVAEFAELLQFHAIRICLLVLVRNIISLFAARASESDRYAHDDTSHETVNEASIVNRRNNEFRAT
jgi:hypothetical protein